MESPHAFFRSIRAVCARTPPLTASFAQLDAANIPVVVASGNFAETSAATVNRIPAPACIPATISVAAVRKDDSFATYSNANQGLLDLLAPGGRNEAGGQIESSTVGGGYGFTSATSQAAAHVSGALALLRNVFPYASPRALEAQLKQGPLVYQLRQGSTFYTKPRLDVDNAATLLPALPSGTMGTVTVTREACYGLNEVSWPAVTGANEYHVEGSAASTFTSPKLFALTRLTTTSTSIEVPATRYIRVRACNSVACGAWKNGNITATYFNGCL